MPTVRFPAAFCPLCIFLVSCFAFTALAVPAPDIAAPAPKVAAPYLDLITTYCVYAKSLWHDAPAPDVGGYWGPGIDEPNKNGAVRGMTDTALAYTMLVFAGDNGWLTADQRDRLAQAGLDRVTLLQYVRANLIHLAAHHQSAAPLQPTWGLSWQSSMWTGNAGPAVLLAWQDLPEDIIRRFKRVAFAEADRIVAKPPKDYRPGDTGAEENGWDTYAPAVALALEPDHPSAGKWFKALKSYAANTYSVKADRTGDAMIGPQRARDIVTTANLFDDFTLENHGFFHPDYVQVAGQELGDSLLCLELGDRIHGTHLADEFRPYAMHHVRDVWERVARPLVLPTGEFALPNGTDWQVNTSMMPGYFGFLAAELRDPIAYAAAVRHPLQALRHRALSPPGKILGDTNMEWFWEPILAKRSSTTLLHLALHPPPPAPEGAFVALDSEPKLRYFPEVKVWLYRNASYFVSAAWGARRMGTFTPFVGADDNPYWTVPIDGILPADVAAFDAQEVGKPDQPQILTLRLTDGRRCYLICLPHSVLWLAPVPLRALAIENDKLSGGARAVHSKAGVRTVEALVGGEPFTLDGWVNIDQRLGLVTTGSGFRYTPTKGFKRRSVGYDQIVPVAGFGGWQMIPNVTAEQTAQIAAHFSSRLSDGSMHVELADGSPPVAYSFTLPVAAGSPATISPETPSSKNPRGEP